MKTSSQMLLKHRIVMDKTAADFSKQELSPELAPNEREQSI
jgi:hypothetical protein